ncbi:NADP-dependent oxidoreductase [Streptomyces sp. AK02-01A]|uniref:NADP-dependent oxidoreductase n=1 Tax=Streptomyces sp. AK02-01A TaxID=3028648 RepID=UPI0029A193CE|nr:NADP-dependent oxidoreductase [Streptomyces sp. AK02-01A]MDX3853931.1 NADP-dependent oxidoreductase [Streptomyces sp. AK02-01A]
MVRAIAATAWRGVDAIEVMEVASRPPGRDEVVVAVHATAISPFDLKRAAGMMGRDERVLPLRLGNEAAGVVTAVGADAVGFDGVPLAVGDEVLGHWLPGAQADEVTLPAGVLLRKPSSLSFAEAAGLLGSGTAAVHTLEAARVHDGDVVLVHGVSGAVGGMVAQLARLRGARVIGTASPGRHQRLRAMGVQPVGYGDGLSERVRALAPGGVSAAIDTVGTNEAIAVSLELVADPSRVVTIANFQAALAAGAQALGPGPDTERIRTAARLDLVRLAAAGRLVVTIAAEYPLERARAAYAVLAGGHPGGKLVLRPTPSTPSRSI